MSDVPAPLVFAAAPAAPDTLNIMLYGPPGSGKSTAAATAPGPILWINAEGPGALAYARKTARQRASEILEVRLDDQADAQVVLRQVVQHIRASTEPRPATVVVDTIGKVREALIRRLVVRGSKNTLQQFGEVARVIGEFVRLMRDEHVNLVLLAHEQVEDADGDRIVRPQIGGALTESLPADMDVVAYCGVHRDGDAVQYLGVLVEVNGRRAKDRSGGLGASRPLDLSEWLAAYRAALTPDESDVPWGPDPEGAGDDASADLAEQQSMSVEAA